MKQIVKFGIFSLFLSIWLCACGEVNSSSNSQEDSSTSEKIITDKIPSNITEDGNNGYGPFYRKG